MSLNKKENEIKQEKDDISIPASDLDPNFRHEITRYPDTQQLDFCFSCGSCSAGCPIHEIFPEFDPKKIAKMVKLGMRTALLTRPYIWYCTSCRNCEQHCPQNVKFFNILNALKNIAAREGHAPYQLILQTRNIAKTGTVFRVDIAWEEKRRSHSLPFLRLDGKKAREIITLSGLDKITAKKRSKDE